MDNRIKEFNKLYNQMPLGILFLILTGIVLNLIPYLYEGYNEFRYFFILILILNINASILLSYLYLNRDKKLQDYKKGLERIKKEPELKEKLEKTIETITYILCTVGVNIIIIGIALLFIQVIKSDIMELFIIIGISLCGGGLYIYYSGHKHISRI